jgi:glycosyltransferase involved in cell wall biosynthesis
LHVAFSLLTLDPGRVGGSETYARGLLEAFAAGVGPVRVTVLAGPRAAESLQHLAGGSVTVREFAGLQLGAGRAGRLVGLLRGMARAPARARSAAAAADVLHLPLTVPIPRPPGGSVLTLFDVLHHDVPDLFPRAERAFRCAAYDGAARRATRVVTVSEHSRRRIADVLGIDAASVVAIHPGVDHVRFAPGPAAADAALLAPLALPDPPWLLYPAALWPHKNHAVLVEAMRRGPADLSLVLTGATFGREPALRAAAARAGVADRVHHLGFVPAATLPALYRAATAVVFPSLAEGFGQPPLEAMACGCPVAASDAGAVAEACGAAALTFPANDVGAIAAAVTRVATDEPLRSELRVAGLERARGFTWQRTAERHVEVYADALVSSAGRRRAPEPRRRSRARR